MGIVHWKEIEIGLSSYLVGYKLKLFDQKQLKLRHLGSVEIKKKGSSI